jgi:hypothetical protein
MSLLSLPSETYSPAGYTYHDLIQPGITQFIARIQGMKPYAPAKDNLIIHPIQFDGRTIC